MLKRRTTIIILSLLALLVPAALAHAKPEIGIQDEDVFVDGKSTLTPTQGYSRLADLGVHRMRILVSSDSVETAGGGFDFSKYDRAVNQAAQNGVKVQFTLVGKHPRPNVPDFARFAAATAQHFKGRVDRYGIWNEPNYIAWLKPLRRAPAMYRKIYAAGYKAIKANDASAKVLIGETVPYAQGRRAMAPIKFLRKMACVNSRYHRVGHCRKLKADGYAHHPYDFEKAPRRSKRGKDDATIGSLSNLTRALAKIAHTGQLKGTSRLYLTEYGYLATGRRGLSERKRASYLKQGLRIARHNHHVKEVIQYLLVQPSNGSPFTTGIVSPNGTALPSFAVLRAAA
jgi:hypothetical protein